HENGQTKKGLIHVAFENTRPPRKGPKLARMHGSGHAVDSPDHEPSKFSFSPRKIP
ncbi:hypothetical protein FRC02_007349, partial [Tulasnella sp. 418]